jgi:hypothetical protein
LDLDIGGEIGVRIKKSLLCSIPGSALDAMFSGRHQLVKVNGRVFIDRDPSIFKLVISYLRSNFKIP